MFITLVVATEILKIDQIHLKLGIYSWNDDSTALVASLRGLVKSINILLTQPFLDLFTWCCSFLSLWLLCKQHPNHWNLRVDLGRDNCWSVFSLSQNSEFCTTTLPPQLANTQWMQLKMCWNPKVDKGGQHPITDDLYEGSNPNDLFSLGVYLYSYSRICVRVGMRKLKNSSHSSSVNATILDKTVEKIAYLGGIFSKLRSQPILPSPLPLEAVLLGLQKKAGSPSICRKKLWTGGGGFLYAKPFIWK